MPPKINAEDDLQKLILSMYESGQAIRDIALRVKMSYAGIHGRLKKAGVLRPAHVTLANEERREQSSRAIAADKANYGASFEDDGDLGLIEGDLSEVEVIDITSEKTGIICDVHIPFHAVRRNERGELEGPYITALHHLKEQGVGTVLLNGDFMDCYQLSRHEKVEQKRNFAWELDVVRGALRHLRNYFGSNVRIIYREGNHEERLPRILATKIPELQGLISMKELLRLDDLGIEWAGERCKVKIGSLWVDHGHEWFGSGGVNPARAYRMKAGDNIMLGHVHRTTFDMFKRPLDGSLFAGWTVGCLCDLDPWYARRNSWNHGVAVVTLFDGGEFMVDNRIILNNRIR